MTTNNPPTPRPLPIRDLVEKARREELGDQADELLEAAKDKDTVQDLSKSGSDGRRLDDP